MGLRISCHRPSLPSSTHAVGGRWHAKRDGGGDATQASRSRRKPGTTERARTLRWQENTAEGLLWQELKGRKLGGLQFTRQFPIGPYFAVSAAGNKNSSSRSTAPNSADSPHDKRRDFFIRSKGYSILRFWNGEVLKTAHRGLRKHPGHGERQSPCRDGQRRSAALPRPDMIELLRQDAPPPSRAGARDTSPPLRGVEDTPFTRPTPPSLHPAKHEGEVAREL